MNLLRLVPLALVLVAACGADGSGGTCPTTDRGLQVAEDREGNITFYLSNQSFARASVQFRIELDGVVLVDTALAVCDQHEFVAYRFQWAPGEHVLRAVSSDGNADASTTVQVGSGPLWGYVFFSFDEGTGKGSFQFHFQDSPIGFA